jgi:hypothetical protein
MPDSIQRAPLFILCAKNLKQFEVLAFLSEISTILFVLLDIFRGNGGKSSWAHRKIVD